MASVNKVILIGNLGKDPELRYSPLGQAVTSFPVATSERIINPQGNTEDRVEWHNIVLWGRKAEVASEHLRKGSSIYIDGRLQTRMWQDRDGKERLTTEVVAKKFQMLGGKGVSVPE